MAIQERDVVLVSTNENNDTIIDMPVTRENCVEGLGRIRGTAYSVGDVALCAGSQSLQLICTASGTTSTNELDITDKAVGDTITDGTVTWVVAKRNYFDNSGTLPIANGGTGATTASDACANIGALPTSGGVMTYHLTLKNGAKTENPSLIFESNGGKKYSFYGIDDGIGIWDITNQKLATLIGNITGTAGYANSAGNGIAEVIWYDGGVYVRTLVNGFTIIGGYAYVSSGGRITFPHAFTGGIAGVVVTHHNDEDAVNYIATANHSVTGFNIYTRGDVPNTGVRYLAWGWAS